MSYQLGPRKAGVYQNIQLLKANIDQSAATAIDIGCNEGVITAFLDSLGLKTFGFEASSEYAKKAAEFQRSNYSQAEICCHAMTIDDIKQLPNIDIVLFLSVNQQLANIHSTSYSEQFFVEVFEKTNMQLFFQPCMIHQKYGSEQGFVENDFYSVKNYFDNILFEKGFLFESTIVGVSVNGIPPSEPFRPLILYTKIGRKSQPLYIPHMDDSIELITEAKTKLVTIDIKKAISSRDLQSFNPDSGYHRFVKTAACLLELLKKGGGELDYKTTPLYSYYQKVQPTNFGELWLQAGFNTDIGSIANMPLNRYLSWMPWTNPLESNEEISQGISEQPIIPEWDSHAFGPQTEQNLANELQRIYNLIVSINQDGYAPELHDDGYIRGTLIRRNGQTRFLVAAGQHRLAVLAALGYQQIVVKYQSSQRIIHCDKVAGLPMVQRGILSNKQAENILDGIFGLEHSFPSMR